MKHTFFLFSLLLSMQLSFANSNHIESILNSQIHSVGIVDKTQKENRIYLNNSFTSPTILNPEAIQQIKGLVIYRIDLVYTKYRSSKTFNQRELNRKRLLALQSLYPEVFKNRLIAWRLVEQKEPASPEAAKIYFHGFILYYRPAGSEEQTAKEIAYIKDLIDGKTPSYAPLVSEDIVEVISKDKPKPDSLAAKEKNTSGFSVRQVPSFKGGLSVLQDYLNTNLKLGGEGKVSVRFTVTKTGEIKDAGVVYKSGNVNDMEVIDVVSKMPNWEPGKVRGKAEDYSYTIPLLLSKDETRLSPELSSSLLMHAQPLSSGVEPEETIKIDSTIFKVFERNKQWQKMSIVCDVTSSMSPYTAQVMLLFKASFSGKGSLAENYTFFNDGDKKTDAEKVIGSTGGIYSGKASSIEQLKNLLFQAMMGGYGGDIWENNLEATLEAIHQCPACGDFIMIADNFATPRDLSLWYKVTIPIHIILCGTSGGVNVDYLNLALKTKGTLHTLERDITFLTEPSEGKKITIGSESFVLFNGKFVRE